MDFGQPNGEIDQKMANGQLLFLALLLPQFDVPPLQTKTVWLMISYDYYLCHTHSSNITNKFLISICDTITIEGAALM